MTSLVSDVSVKTLRGLDIRATVKEEDGYLTMTGVISQGVIRKEFSFSMATKGNRFFGKVHDGWDAETFDVDCQEIIVQGVHYKGPKVAQRAWYLFDGYVHVHDMGEDLFFR